MGLLYILQVRFIKIFFLVVLLGGIIPCLLYYGAQWKSMEIVPYYSKLSIVHLNFFEANQDPEGNVRDKTMTSKAGRPEKGTSMKLNPDVQRNNVSKRVLPKSGKGTLPSNRGNQGNMTALVVTSSGVNKTTKKQDENSLQLCPEKPPGSVGRISINKTVVTEAELNRKYKSPNSSAHFKPEDCRSRSKTAIIIPYRNRERHLWILLNNLIPFLNKQQLEFSIFVVEPIANVTFNRALLINVGFLEALKLDNYTCFVFHDVDLVPENDRNLYRCADHPLHMSSANSKYNYRLPYGSYAGGVIAISTKQYSDVNGISNLYFGWGGEDDDLFYRLHSKGYKLLRYPMEVGRYFALSHGSDKGNAVSPDRFKILGEWKKRMTSDGLNSVKYEILKKEFKNVYVWIYITIDWPYYKSKIDKIMGRENKKKSTSRRI